MRLQRRHAVILLGVAAWNVVTWAMFARNLSQAEGRPTGYYVAHTVLIVVNLAIAGVLATMGYQAWRSLRSGSGAGSASESQPGSRSGSGR